MHSHGLTQNRITFMLITPKIIVIMDNQLYKELTHYLNTLTHLDRLSNQQKTHIRRILTQYFVFNHLLFRKTKDGNRRVIL